MNSESLIKSGLIRKEIGIFLIVGLLTVLIDFLIYRLIICIICSYNYSKALGFISGTIFSYFANRAFTFSHVKWVWGSAIRFSLLYLSTLGTNVLVNHILLSIFNGLQWKVEIAFLLVTSLTATLNFLGMKFYVFKQLKLSKTLQ